MDIHQYLTKNNLQIKPVFDGKWHRFDRDGEANVAGVGHVLSRSAGPPIKFYYAKDHKTGEEFRWNETEGKNLSEAEEKEIQKEFKKLNEESRAETEKRQLEISNELHTILSSRPALEGTHDYFRAKQLGAFGERDAGLRYYEAGPCLLVPLQDSQGKIWNAQRIFFQDGKWHKRYWKGAKASGCFHVLGHTGARRGAEGEAGVLPSNGTEESQGQPRIPESIYIGEGYATCATLYDATDAGQTLGRAWVVSACNAGNLEPVARALREHYPTVPFIIVGDDDRDDPKNPGRTKALLAAEAVGGVAVFPKFAKEEKGLTDFNDLMCKEGLDTVRAQLVAGVEAPDLSPRVLAQALESVQMQGSGVPEEGAGDQDEFVTPLGYAGNDYFYTSSSNPQINIVKEHSESDLLRIMPYSYWLNAYGEIKTVGFGKNKREIREIEWRQLKSDLMEKCRQIGYFEHKRVRGAGVWLDQGKVVVHLGNRLFYGGGHHPLHSLHSNHIYEYGKHLEPVHPEPLKLSEVKPFLELLNLLNYNRTEQKLFLGGWCAVSGICGTLHWRPHIWVTGETGSGKSTILSNVIKPVTTSFSQFHVTGTSTEAGIRQTIKSASLPILFDEFEATGQRSKGRIEQIVELFRQASSDEGGVIAKGSASGEAVEYCARFCGAVASIGTKLDTGADRTRFTLVELKKLTSEENTAQGDTLMQKIALFDHNYFRRLFARMVQMVPVITENQKKLQKLFTKKHSARFGQQYGTLLAGWGALVSDGLLSDEECEKLVDQVQLDQELSSSQTPDQELCLLHLLQKQIRIEGEEISIARKLETVLGHEMNLSQWLPLKTRAWAGDQHWQKLKPLLAGIGVTPVYGEHGPGIVVQGSHPELAKIYLGTLWEHNWAQPLARLPGAVSGYRTTNAGHKSPRGVFIPTEFFIGIEEQTSPKF